MRVLPGNDLDLGTLSGGKRLVLSRRDRARHTYAVGSTRTGKTKLLELMARQDLVQHPRSRCPLVVIDPHSTLYDGLVGYAAGENLKRLPIVPVDLRQADTVVSYNMLRRRTGVDLAVLCRGFVDAILHAWGQSNSNETPRLATWLYAFITFACERDCTLIEALHLVRDPAARRELTDQVEHFVARTTFQSARSLHERDFQDRVESTLYRINRFLSTQLVRAMLCQTGETLDLSRVLDEGAILLVCLSTEGTKVAEEDAATLGSVLLTDLWLAAKRRGKREEGGLRPCYVYLDEFQNYVTPTMAKGLAEASGFGLHFTLAHQFPSQLSDQGELGQMVLNSVLSNAKNKIVFQLSHPDDVEMLASVLYRQDVDPDEVKDEIYQTKVMGHTIEYLPSFSSGTTVGTEQGWQRSRGTSEGHSVGTNWTHTDTVSESFTSSVGTIDATSDGETLSEERSRGEGVSRATSNSRSEAENDGWSESDGQIESSATGSARSEGTNWSEGRGRTSGKGTSRSRGRSDTYGFGPLDEDLQAELRRYEFTKLDAKGRKELQRQWPDVTAMGRDEMEAFKRNRVQDYTLSENRSLAESDSSGESETSAAGGSRSASESQSKSRGETHNRGQTHGESHSVSAGETRGHNTNSAERRARSVSTGTSHADTTSESETYGTSSSDAYGGSEAWSTSNSQTEGESSSTSESTSKGISFSPVLMPIMGRELSSRQFRPIEEQLYRFSQLLDGLPDRHCVVRLASMSSPVPLYVPTVRKPLTTPRWVSRWTLARLAQLPFALSMADAMKAVEAREGSFATRLLPNSTAEPTTARRKISGNAHSSAPEPRRP